MKVPETSYSYTFYGGNVVRVLIYYFLLPLIFTFHKWPLAFLIFSLPLQNSHVVLPTKKMSPLLFISCSRSLSLFLVHSLACRLLSLFLCLSLALFSKFVDMTINLSLILQTTRIQKQLPLSFIVFIDSSVVSALKDSGGYAISSQNNLELHLGCYTC